MNLLDNPLVRKYFINESYMGNGEACAEKVLLAMQAPIRDGDRYIALWNDEYLESTAEEKEWQDGFHPYYLRLPSQFQPEKRKECEHPFGAMDADKIKQGISYCTQCDKKLWPVPEPEKCDSFLAWVGFNRYCVNCLRTEDQHYKPSPANGVSDPVEEKIQQIIRSGVNSEVRCDRIVMIEMLRDLVALARKGSRFREGTEQ